MSLPDPGTLAELVRLPAVLSVPGDAWTGTAWTGTASTGTASTGTAWTGGPRPGAGSTPGRRAGARLAMPAASALIYLGGMALNDWADRRQDAEERPERPIPSGRISPDAALAIGAGMVGAGVVVAGAVGGRSALAVAVPLAGAVWAYDVAAKDTAAGPALMATCRALDVLLGAAGGDLGRAVPAALVIGGHTATVTQVSRDEVHGGRATTTRAAAVGTTLTAAASATLALRAAGRRGGATPTTHGGMARARRLTARLASLAAAGGYAATVGGGYWRAAASAGSDGRVDPQAVRAAVGTGVMGIVPLQASLLAGAGALGRAAVVAAAIPLGKALRRRRAVT